MWLWEEKTREYWKEYWTHENFRKNNIACLIKSHKDCVGLDVKSQKKSRVRKRRRRRYSNCSNSSSDSGDEWTPALKTCLTKKKTNKVMRRNNNNIIMVSYLVYQL